MRTPLDGPASGDDLRRLGYFRPGSYSLQAPHHPWTIKQGKTCFVCPLGYGPDQKSARVNRNRNPSLTLNAETLNPEPKIPNPKIPTLHPHPSLRGTRRLNPKPQPLNAYP